MPFRSASNRHRLSVKLCTSSSAFHHGKKTERNSATINIASIPVVELVSVENSPEIILLVYFSRVCLLYIPVYVYPFVNRYLENITSQN